MKTNRVAMLKTDDKRRILCEERDEAEEIIEHRGYNITQYNQIAALRRNKRQRNNCEVSYDYYGTLSYDDHVVGYLKMLYN
jgi:hypothetical protein